MAYSSNREWRWNVRRQQASVVKLDICSIATNIVPASLRVWKIWEAERDDELMLCRRKRGRTIVEREAQFLHFGKSGEQFWEYAEDDIDIAHMWGNKKLALRWVTSKLRYHAGGGHRRSAPPQQSFPSTRAADGHIRMAETQIRLWR